MACSFDQLGRQILHATGGKSFGSRQHHHSLLSRVDRVSASGWACVPVCHPGRPAGMRDKIRIPESASRGKLATYRSRAAVGQVEPELGHLGRSLDDAGDHVR